MSCNSQSTLFFCFALSSHNKIFDFSLFIFSITRRDFFFFINIQFNYGDFFSQRGLKVMCV